MDVAVVDKDELKVTGIDNRGFRGDETDLKVMANGTLQLAVPGHGQGDIHQTRTETSTEYQMSYEHTRTTQQVPVYILIFMGWG